MLPRTLFYALAAINIVLALLFSLPFLGIVPPGKPNEEPHRLEKQISPEQIRILKPAMAAAPAAAPVLASAPVAPPPATEASAPPEKAEETKAQKEAEEAKARAEEAKKAEEEAPRCVVLKGLQEELANDVSARAHKFNKLKLNASGAGSNVSYWVNIPPEGGKEGAEHRVETLDSSGITDRFIVRDAGENQHAISLGLYHSEELAKRRLDAIQKTGIKNARITKRESGTQKLEVKGPKKSVEAFLASLPSLNKGKDVSHQACQAN